MKCLYAAAALACGLLLAGCLPVTSETPVGTTTEFPSDSALFGTWKGHAEDQKTDTYFHFLADKNGAVTAILVSAEGNKDDAGWMSFTLRTAKLGENRLMNAVETTDNGTPTEDSLKGANIPLLYTIANGRRLTLYLLDEDKVKEAIKAGRIAGSIEPGNFGDVKITADAKTLDAFMATPEAAKLFKVFITLKKVD
ncbi:MAG: hypothetical protein KGI68_07490 [Alphaproteobacteria bacterium]|nr:hypothetical protein [Alphaproteobacteria bacterium]MDE1985937.1 hypothetical protein [Alphaproteobacteria bacterium]MDE2164123.1 hypothetical protein [Alphaproteobacteria bacterium]MDE2264884.1 hypothetical protein [Alphaproteobacteria bacterium]MDE2499303.1 hypothetical protein [Alphaproteobacteria bacterium]